MRSFASLHLAGVYKGGDIFKLAIKASKIRCSCSGGPGSLAEKSYIPIKFRKGHSLIQYAGILRIILRESVRVYPKGKLSDPPRRNRLLGKDAVKSIQH